MSEPKAGTWPDEMTVERLAEIQPGMATVMKMVAERFTQTYYAARGGNWKLAAYQLNQLRAAFKIAKVTRRPVRFRPRLLTADLHGNP